MLRFQRFTVSAIVVRGGIGLFVIVMLTWALQREVFIPQLFLGQILACGNGVLEVGESCDDGNTLAEDGCSVVCTVETGWTCIGTPRSTCSSNGVASSSSSVAPISLSSSSVSSVITPARCGDGIMQGTEQCERSLPCAAGSICINCQCIRTNAGASSSSKPAAAPICGNGFLEGIEQCETDIPCVSGGFCKIDCLCETKPDPSAPSIAHSSFPFVIPRCGDAVRNAGEGCDDGNTISNDGCSAACQREIPSLVTDQSICGNGLAEPSEECDDGNIRSDDGCSSTCKRESRPADTSLDLKLIPGLKPGAPLAASSSVASSIPEPNSITLPNLDPPAGLSEVPEEQKAITISFPVEPLPVGSTTPVYQASLSPLGASSGPIGATGPASLAIMTAGAAGGFALLRRKKNR